MPDINNRLSFARKLLSNKKFTTKIKIYFSTKIAGDDFDPYEKNYTYSNLNPKTIKAYVTQISPQALVYRQYGLENMGAQEVVCDSRYEEWFKACNKIEIGGDEYQVFKEAAGSRSIISDRKFKMIRVVITQRSQ